jgi:hypothetical protein
MKRIRILREYVELAPPLQEQNPLGIVREHAEVVATPLHPGKRDADFMPKQTPQMGEFLIGCTAIRNRPKSLKAKGGCHF